MDQQEDAPFRATFEKAAVGLAHVGTDGTWLRVNDKLCDITGYPADELTRLSFQQITHPDDIEADLALLHETLRGERSGYDLEKRYYRKDGRLIWVHITVALLRDGAGGREYFIVSVEDISKRKRYEEELRLAVHELNHRVRNTLTIVQAIAATAIPPGPGMEQVRDDFIRRIDALASAHALLTVEGWIGAPISAVVSGATEPFARDGRLSASGPELRLPSKSAVSLAITLNELASNAQRHGAFSVPGGHVDVLWTAEEEPGGRRIELTWAESGGPPVTEPERQGFGLSLVGGVIPSEVEGTSELFFPPEGVRCRLTFLARDQEEATGSARRAAIA